MQSNLPKSEMIVLFPLSSAPPTYLGALRRRGGNGNSDLYIYLIATHSPSDIYNFVHHKISTIHIMADLPPLSTIPSLPQETQLRILDTLFEPSPELHKLMIPVLANQTFSSYAALIDAVGGRMSALSAPNSPTDRDVLFGILGSHPRLGRAPANPEHLSELSKKEQAQLNQGAEEQAEKLRALNAEYEEKFPGLRFV